MEALQDFRAIAQGAGAARVFTLATAAVRDAQNGPAFIAQVKKRLGLDVRILSGEEEARYGFLGAVGGLPVEHGVLFDVGRRQHAGDPLPASGGSPPPPACPWAPCGSPTPS